jgi:NADPH:quinone reductase-like Zn-dependent oxidoreductase
VLDHTRDPVADGSVRYDLILDIAGNRPLAQLRRALTRQGTLVVVGNEQGGRITGGFGRTLRAPLVSLFVRQRLTMLVSKEDGADLEVLAPLLATGQVTPALDRTYPLEQAADAMRHLDGGSVRGKVAITVS